MIEKTFGKTTYIKHLAKGNILQTMFFGEWA